MLDHLSEYVGERIEGIDVVGDVEDLFAHAVIVVLDVRNEVAILDQQ